MTAKINSKAGVLVLTFFTLLLGICGRAMADPPGWKTIQLATGGSFPQISGSNVIWYSTSGTFFWDGTTTTQITGANELSGSNVVWIGWDGNDSEIFFCDASDPCNITQITDNSYWDGFEPGYVNMIGISGSNVVWGGWPVSDDVSEIFFWNGSTTTQITNNSIRNEAVQISDTNVVWQGYTSTYDCAVYFWDGSTTTKIPDSNGGGGSGGRPQISGSNVVWGGYGINPGSEIFFWNGSTTTQITNNSYNDWYPQISGSNVVWQGGEGDDSEIFFWDGATTTQVTDNSYRDTSPQISGSNVAWVRGLGSGADIFFWDAGNPGTITQITDSGSEDNFQQISGSSVVWEHLHDSRIRVAVKCSEPPSMELNGDCLVTFEDFAMLAEDWLDTNDFDDLADMASQWLECGYDIQGVCWQ